MTSESTPAATTRWNGWGDPALASDLPFAVRALLPTVVGRVRKPAPAAALADVVVPPSRLDDEDLATLRALSDDAVHTDDETRLRHAGGRSTPDLLRRRETAQTAPDAVVSPADHAQVQALLAHCAAASLAVVPFGGGTSVVGALDPERGAHRAVVALDVRRLSGLLAFDEVNGEARFLAGTTGPEAERLLAERGFELGHYPQSFLYATLGGFASARSSGQNSAGYGRFDTMITSLRAATPTGEVVLGGAPGTAAGPDLLRVFVGAEGTLGVITELGLRVHRTPAERRYEGWTFPDFATGIEALRQVAQQGTGPTVIRLSDETETGIGLAQHGRIGKALSKGCSAVTVFEGPAGITKERHDRTAAVLSAAGGRSTGAAPAEDWAKGRFGAPYLRDALLDHGAFCETLETATTWSHIPTLKEAVTDALSAGFAAEDGKCLVMCHVSHIYPTGAALYFTIVGNLPADVLERWQRIKARVNDTLLAHEGTLSHHHGIGRDHAPWLAREIGEGGMRILRAVKDELDPTGIMNPGALLPVASGSAATTGTE
ncbi:FAD-binding oxidoreductase [Microbacterium pseudoresistens]|uniref:Alkyldihydroxyacetonephosphate synthase n=1 Tax=Microbacterium pseudoresistens TaxID=640634 RepID=A0A7Y9JQ07_9MICO|nr:FAD-binding oxidoreductase [Microbacterium pseudoresistens]NYD55209.1 alkyldihydroxyacetonephosphate synthase [Microbacterium pseudoresistens]